MSALNPQARQVLDLMAASGAPPLDQLSPPESRAASHQGFLMLQGPRPDVASVTDLNAVGPAGPIPLRIYRPAGSAADALLPVCLYFHGGGFVIGDIEMYDNLCRILSNASGAAVVSVEYRLAPEARYPAAVDDCWAATRWIASQASKLKLDAQRMAVGGDSAGGNLAAVVALMARDAGAPKLRHQLLIYPVTQIGIETDSMKRNADGYFLTAPLMRYFLGHYLGENPPASDWRLAPILAASHAGLPPASVLVCGFDPLHDDGVAYADKLRAAGVAVTFTRLEDQIHGFVSMDGAIPAAKPVIEALGRELAAALK